MTLPPPAPEALPTSEPMQTEITMRDGTVHYGKTFDEVGPEWSHARWVNVPAQQSAPSETTKTLVPPSRYLESNPGRRLIMVHREHIEEWDAALKEKGSK